MEKYEFCECRLKYLLIILCVFLLTACSNNGNNNSLKKEEYSSGEYLVGEDIPCGEYVFFASDQNEGELKVYDSESNKKKNDSCKDKRFEYNTIYTANDGEYLELINCNAIPISSNPDVNTNGTGMFKVGTHIKEGKYRIVVENDDARNFWYFVLYSDGTGKGGNKKEDVDNTIFELNDGDYVEVQAAYLESATMSKEEIEEKTKNMSDKEKYLLAVDCYEDGFFNNAILYLQVIKEPGTFTDVTELIEKCTLMDGYQGIYESTLNNNLDYLVLDGWHLYKYNNDAWTSSGVEKKDETLAICEYRDQFYLVDKEYKFEPENAFKLYSLIETDGDNKCSKGIEVIYLGEDLNILYMQDLNTSIDMLEDRYQTEISRVKPYIGMSRDDLKDSTWGEPSDINKTTTAYGVSEQWIYGNGRYIYLEDGVVTAIQE